MFKKLISLARYIKTFKNWTTPAIARYGTDKNTGECMLAFRDGRKISFRPSSDYVALGEIFISDGYKKCLRIPVNSKIIWDIGGNIGGFVVWASKYFPNAHYSSFEPCDETFQVLKRTKIGNPAIKWDTYNFGLSSKDETVNAHIPHGHYGEASRFASSGKEVRFSLRDINEVWASQGKPFIDLLKVDCEGGEYEIFRGISNELIDNIGAVVMEIHPIPDEDPISIQRRLVDAGLISSWFHGQQGVVFATRQ